MVECNPREGRSEFREDGRARPGCSEVASLVAAGYDCALLCTSEVVAQDGSRRSLPDLGPLIAARAEPSGGFLVAAGLWEVALWRVSVDEVERLAIYPEVTVYEDDTRARVWAIRRGAAALTADGTLDRVFDVRDRSGDGAPFPHEVYRLRPGSEAPEPIALGDVFDAIEGSFSLLTGP